MNDVGRDDDTGLPLCPFPLTFLTSRTCEEKDEICRRKYSTLYIKWCGRTDRLYMYYLIRVAVFYCPNCKYDIIIFQSCVNERNQRRNV